MGDVRTIERSLLALMLDKDEAPNIISEIDTDDFYSPEYKAIFELMKTKYEHQKSIDLVVLATELKQNVRDVLDIAGFAPFARGNVAAQIEALKEYRERNELYKIFTELSRRVRTDDLDTIKAETMQLMAPKTKEKELIKPREAAMFALDTYNDRKTKKSNGGIWTSMPELNRCVNGGFEKGQLVILAAPTKKGKSAFAANILRDFAITQKIPSLLINTEMSQEQLSLRNCSILSGVDHYKIATGQVTKEDDDRVLDGIDKLHQSQLYTLYAPDLNINKMTSYLRSYTIQYKIRVAVIDYIGRMDTQDPKLQEHQVLKNAAKRLKTLAQQLKITIIMLAQITDEGNLEGAKAMRNECDLFAHLRPMSEGEMKKAAGFNYCLVIESNRSGPQAKIPLNFYGNILTFTDKKDMTADEFTRPPRE